MLRIVESFRFPGDTNYVFTMDVKSLYTTIPNRDGLLALTHFLDKTAILQPPTHTLVRLVELVLTLNTFDVSAFCANEREGSWWWMQWNCYECRMIYASELRLGEYWKLTILCKPYLYLKIVWVFKHTTKITELRCNWHTYSREK